MTSSILVIDDSAHYREAISARLSLEGYHVEPVGSGRAALELLERRRFDAILLDLVMPGLSGRETCEQIKANPELRDIPLIMLTGHEDAIVDALSAGADDFVMKSGNIDVLNVRLSAQLRRRHYERENARIQAELHRQELEIAEARRNRELAETRAALLADLEAKNLELARLQIQREELSAHIVHDLKNPLSVITLGARFLRKERELSPTGQQIVNRMIYASDTMHRMIMNLLDINRSEANALVLKPLEIDPKSLFDEVIDMMRPRAQDRSVQLEYWADPECPALLVDAELIRRVVENLVDNAIKFCRRDGAITLEARPTQVGWIEMRIRDEGPGIPEDQRDRLFHRYVQLECNDAQTRHLGSGLGLAFCRMAVEAHGGRIWVEPNEPEGSCFGFVLPGTPASAP